MELFAVWNRIDQLEQLIITQAKEIDVLRRVIQTTQVALQSYIVNQPQTRQLTPSPTNNLTVSNFPQSLQSAVSSNSNQFANSHHGNPYKNQPQQKQQRRDKFVNRSNCSPTDSQTIQPIYRSSYMMNPYVHPASAIPPVVNRVITRSDCYQLESAGRSDRITSFQLAPVGNSRTLPTNTRWSTGPSLLGTMQPIVNHDDQEESLAERRKQSRFSLVELVTCFCPCFTMC